MTDPFHDGRAFTGMLPESTERFPSRSLRPEDSFVDVWFSMVREYRKPEGIDISAPVPALVLKVEKSADAPLEGRTSKLENLSTAKKRTIIKIWCKSAIDQQSSIPKNLNNPGEEEHLIYQNYCYEPKDAEISENPPKIGDIVSVTHPWAVGGYQNKIGIYHGPMVTSTFLTLLGRPELADYGLAEVPDEPAPEIPARNPMSLDKNNDVISQIHPKIRQDVIDFINDAEDEGYDLVITTAFRSWETSNRKFMQGRKAIYAPRNPGKFKGAKTAAELAKSSDAAKAAYGKVKAQHDKEKAVWDKYEKQKRRHVGKNKSGRERGFSRAMGRAGYWQKTGGTISGARGGESYHNYGLAIDICEMNYFNKYNQTDARAYAAHRRFTTAKKRHSAANKRFRKAGFAGPNPPSPIQEASLAATPARPLLPGQTILPPDSHQKYFPNKNRTGAPRVDCWLSDSPGHRFGPSKRGKPFPSWSKRGMGYPQPSQDKKNRWIKIGEIAQKAGAGRLHHGIKPPGNPVKDFPHMQWKGVFKFKYKKSRGVWALLKKWYEPKGAGKFKDKPGKFSKENGWSRGETFVLLD